MMMPRVRLSNFRRKFSGKSLPTVAVVYAGIKGSFGFNTEPAVPVAYVKRYSGLGERLMASAAAREAVEQACLTYTIAGTRRPFMWVFY